jgi:hypothetical protein
VNSLPAGCDLNRLLVTVGGKPATATYVGPAEPDGLQQVNVELPEGLGTGLERVELSAGGQAVCEPGWIRLMAQGPVVPRLVSLTDGIDLMSGTRIVTGWIKATVEEVKNPEEVRGWIGERALEGREVFCTDPKVPRWEVNWRLPAGVGEGAWEVRVAIGPRELGKVGVLVVENK